MTAIAELIPTPSTREDEIARALQRAGAQRADTAVFISFEQGMQPLPWLSGWLRTTDCLHAAGVLVIHFRHTRPTTAKGFWEEIEGAFAGTPALQADEFLGPRRIGRPETDPAGIGAETIGSNRAVAAIRDLQQWLTLTVEQVARLVGASRSAVHYWVRENAQPRPGVARNLLRVHGLIRALRAAVGPESLLLALNQRPDAGAPSASELLHAGRYEDAESLLRPLIFRRDDQPVQRPRLIAVEEESAAEPARGLTLHPPVTRTRRVALPK